MKDVAIHRVGVRAGLKPRNEPYWSVPLSVNESLGFRKIGPDRGAWIARFKENGMRKYKALGACTDSFDFHQAREAARKWFEDLEQGVTGKDTTVTDACEAYVKNQRDKNKKEATAHDAQKRFERVVYKSTLGKVRLSDLRKHHLRTWIDAQDMTPASLARTFTALRAALNAAVRNDLVSVTVKQSWTGLELPGVPDNRRRLFLDLTQRRALLAATTGALRDLIEATMLTGARAGEIVNATRRQFDARTKSITFDGKTGERTIPLSAPAAALFSRLAESKLPLARLLVRDDGKPWSHSDWDELIRDAAKIAKLPADTCLYTLRHSWITEAISGGLSILDVARLVGTSVMMIEKHYGHLVDSVARERLSKVQMT
jgi:integrase